jgi:protein involved in polysaccharide export with SLBB domain
MKLAVRLFFTITLLLAGLSFTGCRSSDEALFSDDKSSPPLVEVARFHVGDAVSVTFSGLPDNDNPLPHLEPIKEDGTITLPDIGKVQAAGKTAGELQNEIHDSYVPKFYTHLTVTVSTGDRVYYVRGEVKGAGRQLYVGETTVTKAIASAGDFTDFANHNNVLLIRSNGQRIKVNVDKVMEGKEVDPPVYPGDQIEVKRRIF